AARHHRDQVEPRIAVEVGGGEEGGSSASQSRDRSGVECPVAVAYEHADFPRELVEAHDIEALVAVEIAEHHLDRLAAAREITRYADGGVADAREQGDVVAHAVGGDEIELAVAVEIAGGDEDRRGGSAIPGGGEAARCTAPSDAVVAAAVAVLLAHLAGGAL